MKLLIGIDDTDNLESRGTGWRARELGRRIKESGLGTMEMVTRHQLLVDKAIPYTSHNSSACILVSSDDFEEICEFAAEFLLSESAEGSDAGLCVMDADHIPEAVLQWGKLAKNKVLQAEEAYSLANEHEIYLAGLTGTKIGVIGALAAVGLCKGGNDGRILWLPGLRELSGIKTPRELSANNNIKRVMTIKGAFVSLHDRIDLGEWVRPVMKDNQPTLYVEPYAGQDYKYRIASKEFIKGISE